MLKKIKIEGEARQKGDAPCMIIFCAFDQQMYLIELAKETTRYRPAQPELLYVLPAPTLL